MMFASGVVASSPSSASTSRLLAERAARIRPASEMSRSSTSTPAGAANASMIGSSDWVASAGASSVCV